MQDTLTSVVFWAIATMIITIYYVHDETRINEENYIFNIQFFKKSSRHRAYLVAWVYTNIKILDDQVHPIGIGCDPIHNFQPN